MTEADQKQARESDGLLSQDAVDRVNAALEELRAAVKPKEKDHDG